MKSDIFFSEIWLSRFVYEWNASSHCSELANLGLVVLGLLDEGNTKEVYLYWNEYGKVEIKQTLDEQKCIKFYATTENWKSFLIGSFKASQGVIDGRLKFIGQVRNIIPFSLAFNLISVTASKVSS